MRLTWAAWPPLRGTRSGASSRPRRPGLLQVVVDPGHERVLERDPAPGRGHVVADGVEQLGDRPAAVDRDQPVADLVGGGVDGDGQVDRERLGGGPPDPRDQPDGRDRDRPGRQPEPLVEPVGGPPGGLLVGERLPHPHEDHVGEVVGGARPRAQLRQHGRHPGDLLDHLAHRQVPGEPELPGGAEGAAHGAARLGGDAHRGPPPRAPLPVLVPAHRVSGDRGGGAPRG